MSVYFYLANFPKQVVDSLPADISTGIYYGWASVGSGAVHKMVVSIGWNPYYKNVKKSMVRGTFCSIKCTQNSSAYLKGFRGKHQAW